jgi:hypothetical protein
MPVRLEFFANGYHGDDVLLLYSGLPEEVQALARAFSLIQDGQAPLYLHERPYVHTVDGCALTALRGLDHGVRRTGVTPNAFEWVAPGEAWSSISELLKPFFLPVRGEEAHFQYLNEASGPQVIYSTQRAW